MDLICQTSSSSKAPGESWLAEVNGTRVAVDLGAAPEFGRRASSYSPRIIVLSHDDHDHIGGASTFFTHFANTHPISFVFMNGRLTLRQAAPPAELWVPVDWLRLVEALAQLQSAHRYDNGEQERIDAGHALAADSPESIGELLGRTRLADGESEWSAPDLLSGALNELHETDFDKGELAEVILPFVRRHRETFSTMRPEQDWVGSSKQIAQRVADRAYRIAHILRETARLGMTVRYFDVDKAASLKAPCWVSEGRPGVATIVNAAEVVPDPLPRQTNRVFAFMFASTLTVQNRRALVTFLWPTMRTPPAASPGKGHALARNDGAIIWSDAPGTVMGQAPDARVIPWAWTSVMSAPHHASPAKAHRPIWDHKPPQISVILSGNSRRDCDEWLDISVALRDCTHCANTRPVNEARYTDLPPGHGGLVKHCDATHTS